MDGKTIMPDGGTPAPTAARPASEPLLVDTHEAATRCGVSLATWHRLKAAEKTPAPLRLIGKVLYRTADLQLWVALGCPPRKEFEARRAVSNRST
jgi:hypothetical protein